MSFIDLHIHSNHSSDGEWPVARIFEEAEKTGMAAFSIADHDSVAALPEAFDLASDFPGEYVSNVEISTLHEGNEFHLLAPLVDWQDDAMAELLAHIQSKRREQARERVLKLQQLGFDISYEEVVQAQGKNSITGPAVAAVLLEKLNSASHPQLKTYFEEDAVPGPTLSPEVRFYKDFFLKGKPAYVGKKDLDLQSAISLVRTLKGIPVLAHPGLKRKVVDMAFLETLKGIGLEGLEVYSSYHDEQGNAFYASLAESLGLVITAGSDFHGRLKPNVHFGSVRQGGYGIIEQLKERREKI